MVMQVYVEPLPPGAVTTLAGRVVVDVLCVACVFVCVCVCVWVQLGHPRQQAGALVDLCVCVCECVLV